MQIEVFQNDRVTSTYNEDGSPFTISDYFVVATFKDGTRFRHSHGFYGKLVCPDQEDYTMCAQRGDEAAAERLAAKIRAAVSVGRKLQLQLWDEIDPAYGSDAYIALDEMGHFRELERMQENYAY